MDQAQETKSSIDESRPVIKIDQSNQDDSSQLKIASFNGAGTLEILEIVQILNAAGINCCMVDVAALFYYGAGRSRDDWHICVPSNKLEPATTLLLSHPQFSKAEPPPVNPWSLNHSFPRLKSTQCWFFFQLIPSSDWHFECVSANSEYSKMGIPYPKLEVFAQSLLDTHRIVDLTDLIDGMDLSEEWGEQNLNLDGTNDVEWARKKNQAILASLPPSEDNEMLLLTTGAFEKRKTWMEIVRSKRKRVGAEMGLEQTTRFRFPNSPDPRTREYGYF